MEPIAHAEVQRRNGLVIKSTLGLYFVLGFALAIVVPESLFHRFPGLASSIRLFDPVIPGIARLASLSPFPEVMRAFLIVMWLLLPIAAYRVGRAWIWNPRTFQLKTFDQWFIVGFVALFAAFSFAFLFVFFNVDPSSIESTGGRGKTFIRLLTQHRLGLATIGSLWFCTIATTLGLTVRLTYLVGSRKGARHAS